MTVFHGKVVENESMPEVAPRHHWEIGQTTVWETKSRCGRRWGWCALPSRRCWRSRPLAIPVRNFSGMPQNIVLPIMMRPMRKSSNAPTVRDLRLLDSVERQASWFLLHGPSLERGLFLAPCQVPI